MNIMTDDWIEATSALKRLRRKRAIREQEKAKASMRKVDDFPVGCIVKYTGTKSPHLVGQYGEVVLSLGEHPSAGSGRTWPTNARARSRGGVLILWQNGNKGWSLVDAIEKVSD